MWIVKVKGRSLVLDKRSVGFVDVRRTELLLDARPPVQGSGGVSMEPLQLTEAMDSPVRFMILVM